MKNSQECLDISQANKSDGAAVISYQYSGAVNQHWHLEYISEHDMGCVVS